MNQEKELLISENGKLKKDIAEAKLAADMLKSEVERYHAQMQTLRVQIQTEQRQYARLKASSADLISL